MLTRIIGISCSVAAGLAIHQFLLPTLTSTGWALAMKATNRGELCSWSNALRFTSALDEFAQLFQEAKGGLTVKEYEEKTNLERVSAPGYREFWLQRTKDVEIRGFGWLLAEHRWMEKRNPEDHVRPGDIVLDCGAHVGVFTQVALSRGAAKVVAIEPDPANIECLRRNFPREIADGRVVLAQVGVWSSEGSMKLFLGDGGNTGVNSMWSKESGKAIEVPVTTIDKLAEKLQLPKVSFIKMDIEGAEREALKGALGTLKVHRPRLMLDLNHRPDDATVLPGIIRQAHAGYASSSGPCQPNEHTGAELIPHVTYFR